MYFRLIGELFQLEDFEINLKSGIVVDLYFYTLQYRIIHCVLNMKHSQLLYSWPGLLKRMALIMSKLLLSFQLWMPLIINVLKLLMTTWKKHMSTSSLFFSVTVSRHVCQLQEFSWLFDWMSVTSLDSIHCRDLHLVLVYSLLIKWSKSVTMCYHREFIIYLYNLAPQAFDIGISSTSKCTSMLSHPRFG